LNQFALSDGSAVLLATEEWLTPTGRVIWHQGIKPDIAVALPVTATLVVPDSLKSMTASDLKNSSDAQLQKAIQVLSGAG
jgi:carboxyl-terminal processing protease